jgi:hypothetical protein
MTAREETAERRHMIPWIYRPPMSLPHNGRRGFNDLNQQASGESPLKA